MTPKSDVRTRVAVALAIVLAASAAHAEISKRDMQVLSKSQLIYIATVRKDGNQSKAACLASGRRAPNSTTATVSRS